ncbi:alkene reductase [Cronobacter dublinensis]|uniref:alkene reductase n=1 Tax=Cronobacter dublinensis TaxID=413497 RepID=UPI0024AF50EF|nr:alkene reductase [Cronobacter dublinensis]ELY4438352.1 alkene reductase [Cronobacter dublinensis]MDI7397140.1 alkene reductase [Cronobacter dublinensis]
MSTLLEPVNIGALELKNRVVMAPLTRMRAVNDRTPGEIVKTYYTQRASAGLIFTEATSVTPQGVGYPNTPGIWSEQQVSAWREIVDAVHQAGGRMVLQLWHVGRVSDPVFLNGEKPVAPSTIAPEGHVTTVRPKRPYGTPRALETHEIPGIVEDFRRAAINAKRAGFDAVEIHAANGYLFDQFLHDGSNQRTDEYGGSIENRARFLLETVDALLAEWPADRVGVHLNLMSNSYSMHDSDPVAMFGYVLEQLNARRLAFVFSREALDTPNRVGPQIRHKFSGAWIANEGLTKESAEAVIASGEADAAAFGKLYIANPDLVARFRQNGPYNPLNDATIYAEGATGYTDYPFLGDETA